MTNRLALAREAMRIALQLRRSLSIAREEPINVYDVAEAIGVEIRFMDLPSLEGMFLRDPHVIVVLPCLKHRPRGRITFTCAHELGHFQLGHGTRVDEYIADGRQHGQQSDDEFSADTFASSLLMPRPAVTRRFEVRNIGVAEATPLQVLRIAGELDVGYDTLLTHLRYGLQLVDDAWLKRLQRTSPKEIRCEILGDDRGGRVVLVDGAWASVPIDLEVGDWVAIPKESRAGSPDILLESHTNGIWRLLTARRAGRSKLEIDGITRALRIAQSGYVGSLKYRYLDDPEDS